MIVLRRKRFRMISRRKMLFGVGASLIAAPAIVRLSSIMPVKDRATFTLPDMRGRWNFGKTVWHEYCYIDYDISQYAIHPKTGEIHVYNGDLKYTDLVPLDGRRLNKVDYPILDKHMSAWTT